jgi:hypothetical protein
MVESLTGWSLLGSYAQKASHMSPDGATPGIGASSGYVAMRRSPMDIVGLAGNTLVAAAVTDAWESARHRIACLFGRGSPDPLTERRLDATAGRLAVASPADIDEVRSDLAHQWMTRFADLIEERPDDAAEIARLVESIRRTLPADSIASADHSVSAGRDVRVTASSGGVAAAVIGGSVVAPGPTMPGSASG